MLAAAGGQPHVCTMLYIMGAQPSIQNHNSNSNRAKGEVGGIAIAEMHSDMASSFLKLRSAKYLQKLTYLDPPREAEKSSLLNMAIDPVTTALALLRAYITHMYSWKMCPDRASV